MSDLKNYIEKQKQDADFRKEYEESQAEYQVMRALVASRLESGMTQKELAEKSGIRQSNISRIENGTCSPTISTLQALAKGMGRKLNIDFVQENIG